VVAAGYRVAKNERALADADVPHQDHLDLPVPVRTHLSQPARSSTTTTKTALE
jgi:hypothetical protein